MKVGTDAVLLGAWVKTYGFAESLILGQEQEYCFKRKRAEQRLRN